MSRYETINVSPQANRNVQNLRMQGNPGLPRTQTIEFADPPRPLRSFHSPHRNLSELPSFSAVGEETETSNGPDTSEYTISFSCVCLVLPDNHIGNMRRPTMSIPRTETRQTYQSHRTHHTHRTLNRGFGGFPMPHEIAGALMRRFFPDFQQRLHRTITIPRTRTIVSQNGTFMSQGQPVPYLSFEAVVGRNSTFKSLTREQLEELGGVEYRALTALLWIVGGVSDFHDTQCVTF